MEQQDFDRLIREKEGAMSLAFPALMRKVYVWMTLALIITGVTAYGVAHSEVLMSQMFESRRAVFMVLIFAELALVFGISRFINRLSLTTATLLFILYSALNGATLSVIFLAYSASVITKTFFITAGTFGTMALFGYFTKADLSGLGKILLMALVGIIIASIVNLLFFKSGMFDLIVSYIGVLVFVGLTAYDSQKIKQLLMRAEDADENAQKMALMGSLTLYLDFINLFLYLLRIFGRER